jgi:hypothetical protein
VRLGAGAGCTARGSTRPAARGGPMWPGPREPTMSLLASERGAKPHRPHAAPATSQGSPGGRRVTPPIPAPLSTPSQPPRLALPCTSMAALPGAGLHCSGGRPSGDWSRCHCSSPRWTPTPPPHPRAAPSASKGLLMRGEGRCGGAGGRAARPVGRRGGLLTHPPPPPLRIRACPAGTRELRPASQARPGVGWHGWPERICPPQRAWQLDAAWWVGGAPRLTPQTAPRMAPSMGVACCRRLGLSGGGCWREAPFSRWIERAACPEPAGDAARQWPAAAGGRHRRRRQPLRLLALHALGTDLQGLGPRRDITMRVCLIGAEQSSDCSRGHLSCRHRSPSSRWSGARSAHARASRTRCFDP